MNASFLKVLILFFIGSLYVYEREGAAIFGFAKHKSSVFFGQVVKEVHIGSVIPDCDSELIC